jgi:hypothetical protein
MLPDARGGGRGEARQGGRGVQGMGGGGYPVPRTALIARAYALSRWA